MYKNFLKPLKKILIGYVFCGLGVASDVAQLTNFNLLDFLKDNSPQSYYYLLSGTLVIYLIFVIIEIMCNKSRPHSTVPGSNTGQFISAGDIKNSTIIQVKKDRKD